MKPAGKLFLAALLFMMACSPAERTPQLINIRGLVFGTYYSITYFSEDDEVYQESIDSLFKAFNNSLSYYEKNSLISRINRNETTEVDEWFITVFNRSQEIAEETQGAFDATVSPLVNAWGFGFSDRSEVPSQQVDSILQFVGYEKIRLENNRIVKEDPRVQLDFNAIAKGYAADVVGEFLRSEGVEIYLVDIGGDMVAHGLKPDGSQWRIGLEKPSGRFDDPQEVGFLVEVKDIGLATSGTYRQYFEEDGQRYSHTIDPSTGFPVEHNLLSVSVFAEDGMSADAYATAFMVMGLEKARQFVKKRDELEAFFIFSEAEREEFGTYTSAGLDILLMEDI